MRSRYQLRARVRIQWLFIGGIAMMSVPAAAAQQVATPPVATVEGVVTDDSGDVIPGVTISAVNEASGVTRTTDTGGDGRFSLGNLTAEATYELRAERRGFANAVRSHVALAAGETIVVDFTLKLGMAETVAVTGAAPVLSVARSDVQQTINEQLAHALPLSGREFVELTSLTAGFTGNPNFPNAQGQLYWTNNVLVDGASSFSKWRGASRGFFSGYALESIQQVQVFTSTFSAVVGEALASVTSAITRSGTDTWHGSGLLFARGDALDARPAFAATTPPASGQQFGVSLGGPLVPGRMYVFGTYEGHRSRDRNIVVSPVALNAEAVDNQDEHLLFLRLDHRAFNRQIITSRYNGQFFRWHHEPGGVTLPGSGTQYTNTVHTVLVTDRLQLSGRFLNDLSVQFAHFVDTRRDLKPTVFISRAGYAIEGGSLGTYGFGVHPERTWEAADTASYWIGSHALQFGGSARFVRAHDTALPYSRGAYFFAGAPDTFPKPFLYIQAFALDAQAAVTDPRSVSVSGFLQDDWHPGAAVTLNAGVRYDIDRVSNIRHFDVAVDKDNIQPRVGATWDPGSSGAMIVRGGLGLYTQQHVLSPIERVQTNGPDGAITITLDPDSPLFPTFPASLPMLPASVASWPPRDIYRADAILRNPYSVQASIGVRRLLYRSVLAADYITLSGRDLLSLVDANAPASIQKPSVRTVAAADQTRPLVPAAGTYRKIITLGNRGRSWYRALQVKFDRSSESLQMIGSYTWSRALDMANDQLPEDSRNLAAEKARASTDIAHSVSAAFAWQLPGSGRVWRDWSLSGVGIVRSGRPYTVSWGDDRNGTTQDDARPDGRNTRRTGAYRTIDLAVGRRFHRGATTTEARVEAFNTFNAINYDQYVGELLSPLFSRPVSAFPPRRLQLAVVVRF
jgi:Carboxypeptidase regulatory-like domain